MAKQKTKRAAFGIEGLARELDSVCKDSRLVIHREGGEIWLASWTPSESKLGFSR